MGHLSDDQIPPSLEAVVATFNHFYQIVLVRLHLLPKVPIRVRYLVANTTVLRPQRMEDIIEGLSNRDPASQFNYHLSHVFDTRCRPTLRRCPYEFVFLARDLDVPPTYEVPKVAGRVFRYVENASTTKIRIIYRVEQPTKEELEVFSRWKNVP